MTATINIFFNDRHDILLNDRHDKTDRHDITEFIIHVQNTYSNVSTTLKTNTLLHV